MIECPKCHTKNPATSSYCESCGAELQQFRELDDAMAGMLMKEARKGAYALGFVALVNAVLPFAMGIADWSSYAVAGVFGALALWALRAPMIASAIGLTLYGLLLVGDAIVDPSRIYQGLLGKVIIISVLVGAVRTGLKHREFQRQRGLS